MLWSVSNFHYFDISHDLNRVVNRFFLNVRATLDKSKKRFCIEDKKFQMSGKFFMGIWDWRKLYLKRFDY